MGPRQTGRKGCRLSFNRELSRRLFAHLDAGTTDVWPDVVRQPVSAYTCPDRAERERQELFQRRPLFVGLSSLLPNPGDWDYER